VLNVNTAVANLTKMLGRLISSNIELVTRCHPEPWRTKVDPGQLDQVILNLALNARDAMPLGGKLILETANYRVHGKQLAELPEVPQGEYVMLAVSDTGSGMDAKTRSHLFEPFFTTKEPGKGTGLGLSVIYGFVKQSGGHVTVYSEVGRGTTVNLYLPRIAMERERTASSRQPTPAAQRTGETILLVEDNTDVRSLTTKRLQNLGYVVVEAASGARAVEVLRSGAKIDLVFSDVVMPGGISGFDLADWVRQNAPDVPMLLASGFAEDVARAGEAPAAELEILRKPYTGAELARALRAALDGGRGGGAYQ